VFSNLVLYRATSSGLAGSDRIPFSQHHAQKRSQIGLYEAQVPGAQLRGSEVFKLKQKSCQLGVSCRKAAGLQAPVAAEKSSAKKERKRCEKSAHKMKNAHLHKKSISKT
jgi:hypothetical protein